MNIREQYEYIDLIPMPTQGTPQDDCTRAEVEAAFVFRGYASLKTLFGWWIQVGDN